MQTKDDKRLALKVLKVADLGEKCTEAVDNRTLIRTHIVYTNNCVKTDTPTLVICRCGAKSENIVLFCSRLINY